MGWTVGTSWIQAVETQGELVLAVDQKFVGPIERRRGCGEHTFKVGAKQVTFRRVRRGLGLVDELSVAGIRVPPFATRAPRQAARDGATCARHAEAAAEVACIRCSEALCAACTSVDGVRCAPCLESDRQALESDERRGALLARAFGVLLVVALAVVLWSVLRTRGT